MKLRQALLVVIALCALPVAEASACNCLISEAPGPRGAKAVFRGRVVSVEDPGPNQIRRIKFEVEETFWGSPSKRPVVATVPSDMPCAHCFGVGEDYLVFASGLDELQKYFGPTQADYGLFICSPTIESSQAGRQMQALRDYVARTRSSTVEWDVKLLWPGR